MEANRERTETIIKRHEAHWIREIPPDLLAFRGVLTRFLYLLFTNVRIYL